MEEEEKSNEIAKQIDDILEGKTNLEGEEKRLKLRELFRKLKEKNESEMKKVSKGEVIDT